MRKAFSETLYQMASEDERIIFLTGDLGFQVFADFERDFPQRFINVGVAEAEMVAAAAGLALEGWKPIAYSITSFATGRPYEQIRFLVGYQHLPVMIVGAGRGYTYAKSGVSHHAPDDVALMANIPGMTVVTPGDGSEIRALMPQMLKLDGPSYMSVGRYGEPVFRAEEPPVLGKARLLQNGNRVAILSSSETANEVAQALEILALQGLHPLAYQIHTVKPLDEQALNHAANLCSAMIVVDEHLPNGSLWSSIASWKATIDSPISLKRLGPPDEFALGTLSREALRRKWGYNSESVVQMCTQLWENPKIRQRG